MRIKKCHSDDRREEESRVHKVVVAEIFRTESSTTRLRRFAPLNDSKRGGVVT